MVKRTYKKKFKKSTKNKLNKNEKKREKRNKRRSKRIAEMKRKQKSSSLKSKKSSESSSENSNQQILLPNEILATVDSGNKNIEDLSLNELKKIIKIYDVNDNINYNYLSKCKKICEKDKKYIYTLSFKNRKKIIKKHNIDKKIFALESKQILFNFIKFLLYEFKLNDNFSLKQLNEFNLDNFEKFIIPIFEGTNELKYYYFISIIQNWLKIKENHPKTINYLSFFSEFFNKKSNLGKIEEIFYIIFRIDLIFFNGLNKLSNYFDNKILNGVSEQVILEKKDIMKWLNLIKNKIKEDIGGIKISEETKLTLKENGFKFKPFNYCMKNIRNVDDLIFNIQNKILVSYNYIINNKFNYFNDDNEKKAFIIYINKILKSKVIKEYCQKVKSFEGYEFPFDNKKVCEYLWGKVIFADLDQYTSGITNKEGFGIFIERQKGKVPNGLGYGGYIITVTHEFTGHSIRVLINSNNKLKACTGTPNQSFINDYDNSLTKAFSDGGDKFEVLLFGNKIDKLFIGGNHFLFNINNWNLSLDEFKKGFAKNNIQKLPSILIRELAELKKVEYAKILFKSINYQTVKNDIKSQSFLFIFRVY